MPHQEDAPGIAAEDRQHRQRFGQRCATILEEHRIADFGHQPVVGDHRDEAGFGKSASDERVFLAVAAVPATTINEEQHGQRLGETDRRIGVEHMPMMTAIGMRRHHPACVAILGAKSVDRTENGPCRRCRSP